jgi:hypothetical protein
MPRTGQQLARKVLYTPDTPPEQLPEVLTAIQAGSYLGLSRKRIAELLRAGEEGKRPPDGLPSRPNALDRRTKLVARADVLKFRELGMPSSMTEWRPFAELAAS